MRCKSIIQLKEGIPVCYRFMYDQSISHLPSVLLKTGGEGCDVCDFNQRGSSRQLKHAHKLDENVN